MEIDTFVGAAVVGLGATFVIDLWSAFLKLAFKVPSLSFCLLGRWILHMPEGKFVHASIAAAPQKKSECATGWIAHYVIGAIFSLVFVALVSDSWLERPTLLPAVLFGIGTVLAPFLIMQPSFGLGIAAAKTPSPAQARLRSVITHTVFGVGLYVCAIVLSSLLRSHA